MVKMTPLKATIFVEVFFLFQVSFITADNNLISWIKPDVSVTMSSTDDSTNSWDARNAIDGRTGNAFRCRCCSGTKWEKSPWLQINLGHPYVIKSITIAGDNYYTTYKFPGILWNLTVLIGNESMPDTDGDMIYSGLPNQLHRGFFSLFLELTPPRKFQYLFIRSAVEGYLTICEVSMVEYGEDIIPSIRNISKTEQSSIFLNSSARFGPHNAIDDVKNNSVDDCAYCSVRNETKKPYNSWWQIDLLSRYLIQRVQFLGHCSGAPDQLQGAVILGSNTTMVGSFSAARVIATLPNNMSASRQMIRIETVPFIAQFIAVTLQHPVLTICDIQLFRKECSQGRFGENCARTCHCKGNAKCDNMDGKCPDGCDLGWRGNACDQTRNIIVLEKHLIKTNLSSTYETWNSSLAADGEICSTSNNCNSCARTSDEKISWWSVDLSRQYPIGLITIYGQIMGQELLGFQLFLSNTTVFDDQAFYSDNSSMAEGNYTIQVFNTVARSIKIQRSGVLTICEVSIIEGDCSTGYYGEDCSRQCHCLDSIPCDRITGYCSKPFCKLGWAGNFCDKRCETGYFGQNCKERCYCAFGQDCSADYGICPGNCISGYTGAQCNIVAARNIIVLEKQLIKTNMSSTYETWHSSLAADGETCSASSDCNSCARTRNENISWWSVDLNRQYPIGLITIYGQIMGQELLGFQLFLSNTTAFDEPAFYTDNSSMAEGNYTIQVFNTVARSIKIQRSGVLTICEVSIIEGDCSTGYYGEDCSRQCHCLDSIPCDRITGHCSTPFCKLGWAGISCDRRCETGYFGQNCKERCHCAFGQDCSADYGICPGNCISGYTGAQCNIEGHVDERKEHAPAVVLIGGIVTVALILTIVFTAFSFFFTRSISLMYFCHRCLKKKFGITVRKMRLRMQENLIT